MNKRKRTKGQTTFDKTYT